MTLCAEQDKGQFSLADARKTASPLWKAFKQGTDPLKQREAEAAAEYAAAQEALARAITFRTVAEHYIVAHVAGW